MAVPALSPNGRYGVSVPRYAGESSLAELVETVGSNASKWHEISLSNRIQLLRHVKKRCILATAQMGTAMQQIKLQGDRRSRVDGGKAGYSGVATSVVICGYIDTLIEAMHVVQDGTRRTYCGVQRTTEAAEPVMRVQPHASAKNAAATYPKCDLYTQPGKPPSRGNVWTASHAEARRGACVVLGAGNQPFLSAIDVLAKMFYDNYPVVLKHHDAQALVATHLEWVFQPLRDTGCYAGVHCDVPLTVKMMNHGSVAAAHMTGSLNTHESICWGKPEEREQRKANNNPALAVPMTSELGNVTPIVVVPGMWSGEQVDKVAAAIAFNMRDNAGCNCLAPKAVVLPAEWHLADRFEKAVKEALAAERFEPAWYAGTQSIWQKFYDEHKDVDIIKPEGFDDAKAKGLPAIPWAVASVKLDSLADADKVPMFAREVFAPALVIARLSVSSSLNNADKSAVQQTGGNGVDTSDAQQQAVRRLGKAFLQSAPDLLNKHVWGNLVCSVWVDPDTQAVLMPEVQQAVDRLQYGSVVVNRSTYQGYAACPRGMWGGYQASDTSMANVGSGVGYIQNSLLFDHPRKQALWFEFEAEPEKKQDIPVPLWMCKMLTGLLVNGASGLLTALWPF